MITGDILTSLHVVEDATEIQVTFADGTESSAQVTAAASRKMISPCCAPSTSRR